MAQQASMAFASPGGEKSKPSRKRPIDLVHLTRETYGNRALETEILSLFSRQTCGIVDRLLHANTDERVRLAKSLKGSARAVGAFRVAEMAEAIEQAPSDSRKIRDMEPVIDDVRDYIAAITR
ncbi:Hpt domain-containing protein [Phyllobacterium endophyticum]|uniref:Histidine kinase n=1 Tax=Phyllobacterium endophyticum TaxID=1149773 RepID=A0A2P7AU42_9HYPH|nr:Hpt domain-containing protein [Phyllobacterium endophyticum]MBB3234183.1 chemotaxis protein histidine kinase CheA [Phyllobacterium endophyticum]PSH57739.1 histidine kinase [Phyllobacterium endophyticum]TYR43936.1 Hpt domain-containing protein [Phyllobacterium endophyticum]